MAHDRGELLSARPTGSETDGHSESDEEPPGIAVSLIVCTKDRAARLRPFFDNLGRIATRHPWELVIVDNGSRDGTAAILEAAARTAPFPLIAVHEPQPGLGRARNTGIRQARGRLLAFTDDDCYPRRDYIDRVVDVFDLHDVGWFGGTIELYDAADAKLTVSLVDRDLLLPSGRYLWPGLIQGANMAFRAEVLVQIGGFDPELGPGTGFVADDIDAVARASAAGWRGGFFTAPLVYHHHGRKNREAGALMKVYDWGRGAYYAKLLAGAATRRCFGVRVAVELCRSAIRRPRKLWREIGGAWAYLTRSPTGIPPAAPATSRLGAAQ